MTRLDEIEKKCVPENDEDWIDPDMIWLTQMLRKCEEDLIEISEDQSCWIGEKRRDGCIDFDPCSCDQKKAKELLKEIREENA